MQSAKVSALGLAILASTLFPVPNISALQDPAGRQGATPGRPAAAIPYPEVRPGARWSQSGHEHHRTAGGAPAGAALPEVRDRPRAGRARGVGAARGARGRPRRRGDGRDAAPDGRGLRRAAGRLPTASSRLRFPTTASTTSSSSPAGSRSTRSASTTCCRSSASSRSAICPASGSSGSQSSPAWSSSSPVPSRSRSG